MNLTKNDLRLFELLDWEIDKKVWYWCWIQPWWDESICRVIVDRWIELDVQWEWGNVSVLHRPRTMFVYWVYPTHADVLKYISYLEEVYIEDGLILIEIFKWKMFRLDITKPVQNYSEKSKQNLIEFLETLIKTKWTKQEKK